MVADIVNTFDDKAPAGGHGRAADTRDVTSSLAGLVHLQQSVVLNNEGFRNKRNRHKHKNVTEFAFCIPHVCKKR